MIFFLVKMEGKVNFIFLAIYFSFTKRKLVHEVLLHFHTPIKLPRKAHLLINRKMIKANPMEKYL